MENIHMDIVVLTGRSYSFYYKLRKLSHHLIGLLRDVPCHKIFNMAIAETFEVPREVVEPYYNTLVIRIFFEVFVN